MTAQEITDFIASVPVNQLVNVTYKDSPFIGKFSSQNSPETNNWVFILPNGHEINMNGDDINKAWLNSLQ